MKSNGKPTKRAERPIYVDSEVHQLINRMAEESAKDGKCHTPNDFLRELLNLPASQIRRGRPPKNLRSRA